MDDWDLRKTALTVGEHYRVLRKVPSIPSGVFEVGEKVRLCHIGYSHYDSAHGYTFETADRMRKSYLLGDHEPLAGLGSIFQP